MLGVYAPEVPRATLPFWFRGFGSVVSAFLNAICTFMPQRDEVRVTTIETGMRNRAIGWRQ